MSDQVKRDEFEAWADTLEGNARLSLARHIDIYVYSDTHAAWRGWQAAIAAAQQRIAELELELKQRNELCGSGPACCYLASLLETAEWRIENLERDAERLVAAHSLIKAQSAAIELLEATVKTLESRHQAERSIDGARTDSSGEAS